MTVPRSGPQVKYELLEENKRTAVKASHIWSAVLLVILLICSTIIALYTTWQHMLDATKKKENIDFLMIGPKKSIAGYAWMSSHRGEMYGLATREFINTTFSLPPLNVSKPQRVEANEYKLVCYYSLPTAGVPDVLTPDMISPELCTHIHIAFATVANGVIQPGDPSDLQMYKNITALKKKNPKLKVSLSVEWFTSYGEFSWIVSSQENRTRFVDVAIQFLQAHELDGLDIDWEFPSWPTVVQDQTNSFMDLLQLLSSKFHEREPPLLLTVAAGAPKPIIDQSYNITAMAQYVDFVNVMSYDYHLYQHYLPMTGANAPLYQRQAEMGYFATLNMNWTVTYWLYKGMPASKLVLGIPTYGHSFTLINDNNHSWDAPSSGIGAVGSEGFVTYREVCSFVANHGVQAVFDFENKSPYVFKGKEWISFENEQSVAYKAEYVKEHQLGGAMVFSLNTDDVAAICDGTTKLPLTERIKNVLQDDQL